MVALRFELSSESRCHLFHLSLDVLEEFHYLPLRPEAKAQRTGVNQLPSVHRHHQPRLGGVGEHVPRVLGGNSGIEHLEIELVRGANHLMIPFRQLGLAADAGDTAYLAPQVLTNVDHSMSVMREESFGPTVGIMKVTGDEEAIRLMNDSPYGLSAAIWTSDVDAAEAIGEKLETGTVFMNRCDYLDPALAWTGVKDTGRGASLSRLAYESLTRPKSYHLRQI